MKSNHLILATITFLLGLTLNGLVNLLDVDLFNSVDKLPDSELQQGFIFDGSTPVNLALDDEQEK